MNSKSIGNDAQKVAERKRVRGAAAFGVFFFLGFGTAFLRDHFKWKSPWIEKLFMLLFILTAASFIWTFFTILTTQDAYKRPPSKPDDDNC